MQFDIPAFLNTYESELGKLKPFSKQGLEFLLNKINNEKPFDMLEHVAYFLATIYWETGNPPEKRFHPVKEVRASKSQAKLRAIQDKYWHTGAYGRGFVQITWPENYCKFGLCSREDYDKALEPNTAFQIAVEGMKEGKFARDKQTKKPYKLSTFINPTKIDYRGARRIINGTDKADIIAGVAISMERALRKALTTEPGPGQEFDKNSATPKEASSDTLDSIPSVSRETAKKGGQVALKVLRNVWTQISLAIAGGEYLKLSLYLVLAVILGILIFKYRKQIVDFGKKVIGKISTT